MMCLIDWMNQNGGLAGWVQGIGSILALAVAIGVAANQGRQSRNLVREQIVAENMRRVAERDAFLDQLIALSTRGDGALDSIQRVAAHGQQNILMHALREAEDIRMTFKRVLEVPAQDWPSPFIASAVDRLAVNYYDAYNAGAAIEVDMGRPVRNHQLDLDLQDLIISYQTRANRVAARIKEVRDIS